jgi:TonB family protein
LSGQPFSQCLSTAAICMITWARTVTRSRARTETNMRNTIATAVVAVAVAPALAGQAQAPLWVGAWELDPAQSEYRAGPAAARETMTIVPYVGAYKIAINRTDLGGRTAQTEAIARFDGTDVLAIGFRVPTTRAFTTVDDRTFEIADKVNGLVTLRRRAAVSADGRTLTLTEHGVDEGGQNVDAVLRFVRGAGGIGPGTGSGIASPPLAGVVRVGSPGVTIPRVLKEVKPQYLSDAMRAKIQGSVVLECVVQTDGTVGDVRVIRSLDATYGLDQEAIRTAKQWKFAPGTRNGEPVPVMVSIELTFTLGKY